MKGIKKDMEGLNEAMTKMIKIPRCTQRAYAGCSAWAKKTAINKVVMTKYDLNDSRSGLRYSSIKTFRQQAHRKCRFSLTYKKSKLVPRVFELKGEPRPWLCNRDEILKKRDAGLN